MSTDYLIGVRKGAPGAAWAELLHAAREYRSHIASFKPLVDSPMARAQYRLDAAIAELEGVKK